MGIYSEDRTMLTVDPNAESKVIEGYSTINDLYRIMEESIHDDSIISRAIYESMASILSLDEADGAKIDKRVNIICKIAEANNAKLAKVIAKTKSVCAGTKDTVKKYSIEANTSLSNYEEKFNRNKDLASSSKFTIKYNKKNLKFTEDYINKFASNAGKALKDIANNSINIAIKDTENINKNKNNVFKIIAIEKYAKNLCICEDKSKQINDNPFTDGFTISKLEKDLSSFNSIKALDSFCSNATQALEIFVKNTNKLCEKVKNSKKDVSQEDIDAMKALTVLSSAIGKATIHVIKDIANAYTCYINECIRIYIGVAKLKAVRVTKEAAEPTKNDVVKEAKEPTNNDTVVKEEIEAVKNDDNLDNSKKIEGEFEDDLTPITDGDIEKILNNAPEDETKKDEGIDPVKPSDVPMNDGSAHEAAEPTKNDKDTSLSDSTIIYTDTIESVAEAYIISQELKFMTEMNI